MLIHTETSAVVAAFFASLGLTPLFRRIALAIGFLDQPNARKFHRKPMPMLGGIALFLAAGLSMFFMVPGSARREIFGILTGATLLLVTGLLDDGGRLNHQFKLFVAMPVAAGVLVLSGIRASFCPVSLLLGASGPWLGFCHVVVTLIWVVGITAAFSILDHMDGLCAGIAALASFYFLVLASLNGQVLVGLLAAAMLGATLGFLRWNFAPARIFMGDSGALFLGFMMAVLGIKLRFPEAQNRMAWFIPVLILGVPVFDTALVIISRLRRGLVPFRTPGCDHTAHRLVRLGWSPRGAVLFLYGVSTVLGGIALLVPHLDPVAAYLIAALLVVFGGFAAVYLERAYARCTEPPREEALQPPVVRHSSLNP